jgi:hypothetical protein
MRKSSTALAIALLSGLALASPIAAQASPGGKSDNTVTPLSAPSAAQQLDTATADLRAGHAQRAEQALMVLQNRLIRDSEARNLPANVDSGSLRAAVAPLDAARGAILRGDTNGALAAIATARGML